MSDPTDSHNVWWHVEGVDERGSYMVGCRFDNLADASDLADRMRRKHRNGSYRVVRIESIRQVETEA